MSFWLQQGNEPGILHKYSIYREFCYTITVSRDSNFGRPFSSLHSPLENSAVTTSMRVHERAVAMRRIWVYWMYWMIWVGALDNPGVLAFCTFDIASTSPCLTKANKNKIPHSSHQHSSALFAVEKPKNKKVKQSADAHLEERIDDNDLNSAAAALQDRESSSYSLGLTPYLYPTKGKRKRLRSRLRPRLRFFSPFRSDSKKNWRWARKRRSWCK